MLSTVLVVDDDPIHRSLLERIVTRLGYEVRLAASGEEAITLLSGSEASGIDAMLLDLVMPDLDGLGVLHRLRSIGSMIPVITMVTSAGVDGVMGAITAGATDFVIKPVGPERLQVSLMNALRYKSLMAGVESEHHLSSNALTVDQLASVDPAIGRLTNNAGKALKGDWPVLIEGEDGVGKKQFARAIHGSSQRAKKLFVSLDCSALPSTESVARLEAAIQRVKSGTLYLSSINALDLAAQSMLAKTIMMAEPSPKTPRLIASSRINLIDLARSGVFREDLFYRLTVTPLRIPPLRERPFDLSILAERMALRFASESGKNIRGLTHGAVEYLMRQTWPGNHPEFEATLRLAIQRASTPWLTDANFDGEMIIDQAHTLQDFKSETLALFDASGSLRPFAEIESEIFEMAQRHCGGSLGKAAKALGLGRSTLYRKFQEKDSVGQSQKIEMLGDAA
jgi:DNA-binding NtrC family response regulator